MLHQPTPVSPATSPLPHLHMPQRTSPISTYSLDSSRLIHNHRRSRVLEFDPLSLNPTFPQAQAPPRLHERPFINLKLDTRPVKPLNKPYHEVVCRSPTPLSTLPSPTEPQQLENYKTEDFFYLNLGGLQHQTLRSRWSESTIHTTDAPLQSVFEDDDDEDNYEEPDEDLEIDAILGHDDSSDDEDGPLTPVFSIARFPSPAPSFSSTSTTYIYSTDERSLTQTTPEVPNFSYKRDHVPRRFPMRSLNSIEELLRNGSEHKRHGVIFSCRDESLTRHSF